MGVRTRGVSVNQRRSLPLPAVADRFLAGSVALDDVRAIALLDEEVGEARHELGYAPSGGLDLHRNRDGIPDVLHQEDHRELQIAGGVQCLPELSFGCGAVSGGANHHLVLFEPLDPLPKLGQKPHTVSGLGASHGVEELGARRRRHGGDVQGDAREVGGHLAPAGGRVVLGAHSHEEVNEGGLPHGQRDCPVPVL